ncbi:MAG: adenosine kinase [Spirochaetaceae bacterium]|nr:MAG: adenosine kinase [Spirochaetaceae bacterium]
MNTVNNGNNGNNNAGVDTVKTTLLYGLGNPLLDVVYKVEQEFPTTRGLVPGSMNLVDEPPDFGANAPPVLAKVAGGSCANTMRGIAWLSGSDGSVRTIYGGTVGADLAAEEFREALRRVGVVAALAEKDVPTGCATVMVTPDAERTMCTYLGASGRMSVEDIDVDALASCDHLHSTGYFFESDIQRATLTKAVEQVKARGGTVSFDVSDSFVIERHLNELISWLPGRVDTLFANRDELAALTGLNGEPEQLFERALEMVPEVALKLGAQGCIVGGDDGAVLLPAEEVIAIDTNGAGDSFAAGFLFARLMGEPRAVCARMANQLAGNMVTVIGCDYDAVAEKIGGVLGRTVE